jgi:transcription elongation factor Elf1
MVSNKIDTCPFCNATPNVIGRWRFQVSCDCGACGPKVSTQHEAINRWSSVVHYIGELRRDIFATPQALQMLRSAS